jgi:hypothetical protein
MLDYLEHKERLAAAEIAPDLVERLLNFVRSRAG